MTNRLQQKEFGATHIYLMDRAHMPKVPNKSDLLSNAEIADRLASLGQILSAHKENTYKVRAYQRAARSLRSIGQSVAQMVREQRDLTELPSVGKGIAAVIEEIVKTGSLSRLDTLRSSSSPQVAELSEYPRVNTKGVLQIYKKLRIASVSELGEELRSGHIEQVFGPRVAQQIRHGLEEPTSLLLYHADQVSSELERYVLAVCHARRAMIVGECRRRVEVVEEISLVVECDPFGSVVECLKEFGGRTAVISSDPRQAIFSLPAGVPLRVAGCSREDWAKQVFINTGSHAHLEKLREQVGNPEDVKGAATEAAIYKGLGLPYIEPELREGNDEIELARSGKLPMLVTSGDIRGDLHAHSHASDGRDSIIAMVNAARDRGYSYLGITDHSRSLKIAHGLSIEELWKQIFAIDQINEQLDGFHVLKSSEVDILQDGSLDYPDELLRELDYTVCSIHSRFGLGCEAQTERIMRAMDNLFFSILGHATGRLLLKRPGCELDVERLVEHAKARGCFFEINCSPDRLDLSAENARTAARAGIRLAISTDSHSVGELGLIERGIDQARRAGLSKKNVLNCLTMAEIRKVLRA